MSWQKKYEIPILKFTYSIYHVKEYWQKLVIYFKIDFGFEINRSYCCCPLCGAILC